MLILSILIFTIMLTAALIHFYWAFGGQYGLRSSGPSLEDGKNFIPSRWLIFTVSCLLLSLSFLALQLVNPMSLLEDHIHFFGYGIALIFIIRAVGDFKYVGLFKTIYNSSFAQLDTRYFSPLILILGISFALLSRYGISP